jgi:serine/threonine protein kinase
MRGPKGVLSAMKLSETRQSVQLIQREIAIHKELKHPLILEFRGSHPGWFGLSPTIVTDFAENGSLASHLSLAKGVEQCQLRGATRVSRIIVGIVLVMRYLHAQRVFHCNLTPDNILLDWDWTVRIGGFGHSISPDEPAVPIPDDQYHNAHWASADFHYLAPECYDDQYGSENDVCSFGLILYELMTREPAFPKHLNPLAIAKLLVINDKRPTIPAFVLPAVKKLICQCWKRDPKRRPTFHQILNQLEEMKFKLTANVNSSKLSEFVKSVKDWEETNATPTAIAH